MPETPNATKCDTIRQILPISQEKAITFILGGFTDQQVAEQVGVVRQTVWRWRNQDPDFIAELNERRQELWAAQKERLRSMIEPALDALEERVKKSNYPTDYRLSAAVHILHAVGLYGADFSPTLPDPPRRLTRIIHN